MSNFSGFDSEATGFDSVTLDKQCGVTSSTQTTEFAEESTASQTHVQKDCGSSVSPEELATQDDILKEYPPPGLNEFLRRVVPGMMEQLDQNSRDLLYNSSDSEEEDVIVAKLVQEMKAADVQGGGDQPMSVLDISLSSAGNSLAVSIGTSQHENWCTHNGLIRIYTLKLSAGDRMLHSKDISEKNCVSVVEYHPSLAAWLAYGTTSGEVVLCNLSDSVEELLTSPSGCHGCKRVSFLQWADAPLANIFLTMQIKNKGKRRSASDQVLISSGSDGTMNVWQVNSNSKMFENVVTYAVNGSRKMAALDITCFDFVKAFPLRPCGEKVADDIFVVGTKTGALFLCKIREGKDVTGGTDPVYDTLEGHSTCIIAVSFSSQRPGVFSSVSIDSELRIYDVKQTCPMQVFHLDAAVSCIRWLPASPTVAVAGVAGADGPLKLYNSRSGTALRLEGIAGDAEREITCLAISQTGACRVAAGDSDGGVRVWELPSRRIRLTEEDFDI